MAFYYNQNYTTSVSAFPLLKTMVNSFVASGCWTYISSSETSMLFEIKDSYSIVLPFYVNINYLNNNSFEIIVGSELSGGTTINNNGTTTPYKIIYTDTMTGTLPTQSEFIINGYDSGLTIYGSKFQSEAKAGTIIINIERCYNITGVKQADIGIFGYYTYAYTDSIFKLRKTYTSPATSSAYTDLFNVIISPSTKLSHNGRRPVYFQLGEATTTNQVDGWLPNVPYFNPDTLSLMCSGPFLYSLETEKLFGNPYLLTCINGESQGTSTSVESPYPYLVSKTNEINIYSNGAQRLFYVPLYCYSKGNSGSNNDNILHHYYLLAKE